MPEANSTLCFSHMWRSSYRTAWGWKSQGCLRWPHRHFGIRDRFCPSATAGNYEIKDLLQVLTYLSFDSKHMRKKGMSDDRKIHFWMELLVLPPTNTRFMMTEHIFCCGCLLLLFIFTSISLNTYDIKEKKKILVSLWLAHYASAHWICFSSFPCLWLSLKTNIQVNVHNLQRTKDYSPRKV